MALSVPLQELTFGACPYLPGAPPWKVSIFSCWEIPAGIYEALLGRGFRRSGASFYCTICDGCDRCIPIRIDAAHFKPTNSQRRVERRNADLDFYFDPAPSGVLPDRFRLYQKFCRDRFGRVLNPAHGADSYTSFLVESPLGAVAVTSYSVASPSGPELVGNGYLDVLPDGLSSIYFAWSMAHGRRSPGVYSILREI
ncbi:MAG TPA: hypothetical protein VLH39_00850, partial [Magnetospirillaceae bacterium]|nr:hypothetical protein [Magnetospirillaceae bacterium]